MLLLTHVLCGINAKYMGQQEHKLRYCDTAAAQLEMGKRPTMEERICDAIGAVGKRGKGASVVAITNEMAKLGRTNALRRIPSLLKKMEGSGKLVRTKRSFRVAKSWKVALKKAQKLKLKKKKPKKTKKPKKAKKKKKKKKTLR
eukprot:NODE_2846_length_459_cov_185.202439_g2250_i0.p1 GENE.NODE_2846_length_459_cov_185.202439_g2250_i0~~NODE_2846_length_459_cov_185.202439_g2250_i0.p1  ORF type:complete len:144 (+),score=47.10 NODE_2846_length_459_cov_185.202439_g2250_i0:24-455(+)